MYRNLRTNLPREVMSYTDFPFTRTWQDSRRFCSHQEVHLLSAASYPGLIDVIKLAMCRVHLWRQAHRYQLIPAREVCGLCMALPVRKAGRCPAMNV